MAEHPAHQLPRLGHRGTVRGVIDAVAAVVEFRQARHIGRHVAIGRADHAGRPGHDMVAGEQRPRSEEHTSELQSLMRISYAVFCLKKKKKKNTYQTSQPTYTIQSKANITQ